MRVSFQLLDKLNEMNVRFIITLQVEKAKHGKTFKRKQEAPYNLLENGVYILKNNTRSKCMSIYSRNESSLFCCVKGRYRSLMFFFAHQSNQNFLFVIVNFDRFKNVFIYYQNKRILWKLKNVTFSHYPD